MSALFPVYLIGAQWRRATIVIKCDMDFVLYPLDVQSCPVDFSSCKFRRTEIRINKFPSILIDSNRVKLP